jgi:Beta-galactosidase
LVTRCFIKFRLLAAPHRSYFVRSTNRFLRAAILVLLIAVFLIPPPFPAATEEQLLIPPAEPVPQEFFGLHIHHLWKSVEWPDLPFGTWRLWDAHVTWALLEPKRNTYDFSLLDRYVEVADAHHVQIILTLAGTPTWASARPEEYPMHEGGVKGLAGAAAEPASDQFWLDFVRTVGQRYKGKIRYYEIWNEPMAKPFYSGTVPDLIKMTRSARDILKQTDPSNQILSPPVDGSPAGFQWIKDFLDQGGGDSVDIYGFHLYVPGAPELMLKPISQFRAILSDHHQAEKPFWNTEAGWQMNNRDPQLAADYVARAFLIAWAAGVKRYMFYSWDNETMGIMPKDGHNGMAAAYHTVAHWMVGSKFGDCAILPDGTWIEHLTLSDGQVAKIAWNTSGTRNLAKVHLGSANRYETLDGKSQDIRSGAEVPTGGAPILLLYPAAR